MTSDYGILASYIVDQYRKRVSGSDIKNRLVGESPVDRVMVGMLSEDRNEVGLDGEYKENMDSRFDSIPSISLTFLVKKNEYGEIYIAPKGLLFFNVLPKYDEVVDYLIAKYSEQDSKEYKSIEELCDMHPTDQFFIPQVYKKIDISEAIGKGIKISLKELHTCNMSLQEQITEKLDLLSDNLSNEIRIVPDNQISFFNLKSEEEFKKVCSAKDERVSPRWTFDIDCRVVEEEIAYRFSLQLVNNTPVPATGNVGYIPKLFNAGMSVTGNTEVEFCEIELGCFATSFKERIPVYAIAENASAEYIAENNEIRTDNIPIYFQHRLKTNNKFNDYTTFENMINNPISNLRHIHKEMEKDMKARKNDLPNIQGLSDAARAKLHQSMEAYEDEVNRFNKGIEQIEFKDDVKRAFIYMNKAFAVSLPNDPALPGWRLFQIVFIVSMLPEMIRSEYPDDTTISEADLDITNLLYFPTGGGKTEAFLGACIFDMFFDRLRGKNDGVTAILKYPLRLLAVQQLDRVLKAVMKANLIKETIEDIKESTPFRVGFYVGKENTPNNIRSLELEGNDKISLNLETDIEELNEHYRFIDTCPICGKKNVQVRFDKVDWRLKHLCMNAECKIKDLPILIVDNEIYRLMPSVVVSTIDKMAMLGTTNDFKQLMGQARRKCQVHGFTNKSKCDCGDPKCGTNLPVIPLLKDPAPTLYIQDEMHLVRESLGTFDSHYESFIQYYVHDLLPEEQRKKICFIGATATISQYEEHIRELYHTEGRRFPCEYPTVKGGKDFYSYTDYEDITRIMLGYAPYGRTVTNAMWESLLCMRIIVFNMIKNYEEVYEILKGKGLSASLDGFKEMLYNYWISIVYNNRKNDVYEVQNTLQNQANNMLEEKKIPKFNVAQMTSDEDFQQVRKTLFEIQENKHDFDATNVILATSTISHGVDEDAFNVMYFFGMPSNNAEYIQAYSRTGRKYTGIVIDIIRLLRVRDRSYLKNFVIFHQNKDDLVEAVPISRWAKNAVYSTLPGLFAGLIYQYYTIECGKDSLYKACEVKQLINDGQIEEEDVVEKLIEIYGCNASDKLSLGYEITIRDEVHKIMDGLANGSFDKDMFLSDAIRKYTHGKHKPMTSLRDTEESVEIKVGG